MSNPEIRVRVAPSPTGDPHVGTAYQALFNYVFAKRRGGTFILRIEDTDRTRSTAASERAILDALRWLGLPWDEGPDVGGPHGPYRQSERTEIYREHVNRLLLDGHAYRCFCPRERLETIRRQGKTGYDRRCRHLSPVEVTEKVAAGLPFVVRLMVPLEGVCRMHDLLRGVIEKDWATVDDQILQKSDGFPTYHLANVVDDHLMRVSHVIRGEEWINSVPKHLLLYRSFGWEPPLFCHLPLLRNNDANRSKLSKRKNPTSINYYRRAGFLPEALLNFLGMMGWTMPGGEEKFTVAEMAEHFDLERISLGGPIFDVEKLRWLNGRYLRENRSADALFDALQAWGLGADRLRRLVPLVQPRLETLADWGPLTAPFFCDRVPLPAEDLVMKGKRAEETASLLQLAVWSLEADREFTATSVEARLQALAAHAGVRLRDLTGPFYVALSGSRVWTPLFHSMEILGSDMVRVRLRRAVEALGGLPEKRLRELEKEFEALGGSRSEEA